jgi:hypothetical protein
MCVYASNYPPVGRFITDTTTISFTGTPMYDLIVKKDEGSTETVVPVYSTYQLLAGHTLSSFYDKTGAPGIIMTHAEYCEAYVPGAIGGEGAVAPSCVAYVPGVIGGEDSALPSCAAYRAGSIGVLEVLSAAGSF